MLFIYILYKHTHKTQLIIIHSLASQWWWWQTREREIIIITTTKEREREKKWSWRCFRERKRERGEKLWWLYWKKKKERKREKRNAHKGERKELKTHNIIYYITWNNIFCWLLLLLLQLTLTKGRFQINYYNYIWRGEFFSLIYIFDGRIEAEVPFLVNYLLHNFKSKRPLKSINSIIFMLVWLFYVLVK